MRHVRTAAPAPAGKQPWLAAAIMGRALAHVWRGLRTIRREFGSLDWPQRQARVQHWSSELLQILDIRLQVQGPQHESPGGLVVINHLSWLDIVVVNAAFPVRFVSKSDVKRWPVLGALILGAGTLLIERSSRRDAMRVVHQMSAHLADGHRLAIFPEGTTHDGSALLPFHANLIQAAISAQAPITPVGLSFWDGSGECKSAAPLYIGNMSLIGSIWRTLRHGPVHVKLVWDVPQHAQGRSRREWARDLQHQVARLSHTPAPQAANADTNHIVTKES